MEKRMQAGEFKALCLRVMEEVKETGQSVIITKRHLPIVKISPIKPKEISLFGKMRNTIHIKDDITNPIGEEWDACN